MNNLTLKQLRYFDALAHHAHFGRAADACAISQPALSVQIKELEETLGTPLFERGPRHVRLTSFGEECVVQVRAILRDVDALGELARASRAGLSGKLRIGVIPTIAPYLLPALIGKLRDEQPQIDVHVRETVTPRLVKELADGRIDTAIVALPVNEPSFQEVPLFSEAMVLVRPAADALTPVPRADGLQGMRLLLLEEGHCFRDQALSFINLRSPLTREGLDGSSLSTLVQMVGAGIGLTLIPEIAVPFEVRASSVHISRFRDDVPRRTIGLVMRRTSPMVDQLDAINAIVRDLGAAKVAEVAREFP